MKLYPAIKANMGDWSYYIVRMKMRDVAREISFASDIYEDQTLSDAIQRAIDESRVKKELVSFLAKRPDRFFSSLVVAAIGGSPSWFAAKMDESVVPEMFVRSFDLTNSFGILCFDGDPTYYALDGQHRLKAIRMLVDGEDHRDAPDGFLDEHISVLVVLRRDEDVDDALWMQRYRRLFSSLNRYAKPTDKDTNIIMDEDDAFAIVTRRLITEHSFFKAPGRERDSFKVRTSGKSVRSGSSHFTSLQTLYDVNKILLSSRERKNTDWSTTNQMKQFMRYRPDEDVLEGLFSEVCAYWDGLIEVLPDLTKPPATMRHHDEESDAGASDDAPMFMDHLAFWPIGQILLAEIIRDMLDDGLAIGTPISKEVVAEVLRPLEKVSFNLHEAPWKHSLLVGPYSESSAWRMRSEDRKQAIRVCQDILRWVLDIDSLDDESIENLRADWDALLYLRPSDEDIDSLWAAIVAMRTIVVTE